MKSHGIPTKGAKGYDYRSRIEAVWSYVFEKLGWEWDYEPIDLDWYIPDFILKTTYGEKILCEIKGDVDIIKTYEPYLKKIINSGWKGRYIILGSTVTNDNNEVVIGVGGNTESSEEVTNITIKKISGWVLASSTEENLLGKVEETNGDFNSVWVEARNLAQWKVAPRLLSTKPEPEKSSGSEVMINLTHPILEEIYQTLEKLELTEVNLKRLEYISKMLGKLSDKNFDNMGSRWNSSEEIELMEEIKEMTTEEIAKLHGRSENGIYRRVKRILKRMLSSGKTLEDIRESTGLSDDNIKYYIENRRW